jgi:hypothetical protein
MPVSSHFSVIVRLPARRVNRPLVPQNGAARLSTRAGRLPMMAAKSIPGGRTAMFANINHMAMNSPNWPMMAKFYEAMFGLKPSGKVSRPANGVSVGDGYVGLNINPLRDGYVGGLDHFGMKVDSVDAAGAVTGISVLSSGDYTVQPTSPMLTTADPSSSSSTSGMSSSGMSTVAVPSRFSFNPEIKRPNSGSTGNSVAM